MSAFFLRSYKTRNEELCIIRVTAEGSILFLHINSGQKYLERTFRSDDI